MNKDTKTSVTNYESNSYTKPKEINRFSPFLHRNFLLYEKRGKLMGLKKSDCHQFPSFSYLLIFLQPPKSNSLRGCMPLSFSCEKHGVPLYFCFASASPFERDFTTSHTPVNTRHTANACGQRNTPSPRSRLTPTATTGCT